MARSASSKSGWNLSDSCLQMPICDPSSSSSGSGYSKAWIIHGVAVGAAAAVALGAHAYMYYRRPGKFRSRVVGIIPARFASSRFEGKPLVHILGKPMIQVSFSTRPAI